MKHRETVLVVAPHPDDETIGCGGALLRHKEEGDAVHWLTVTGLTRKAGFSAAHVKTRRAEMAAVAKDFGFASSHALDLPPAGLDALPLKTLIGAMAKVFDAVKPAVVYVPWPGDAHSDHKAVFAAAAALTKTFRRPSVRRLLAYETLSETDHNPDPRGAAFSPNVFVDVSRHLERKLAILRRYGSELGPFPFPRSERAVRASAMVRGGAAGLKAAEAFVLLKERA